MQATADIIALPEEDLRNVGAAGASMKLQRGSDFNVTKLDIYTHSLY
jgi:hypothetical protein